METTSFKYPEEIFRGTDFWMLNGELSESDIEYQLTEMKDKGVYSFIARTYLGLKSDYPGPNFKSKIKKVIEISKKLGLKVFLQAGYMPEAVLGLPESCALKYIYPVTKGEENGRRIFCTKDNLSFVEHNSVTFLDMFDHDAMEYYLKVSYEDMWKEFEDEYGKTVMSIWVDEPSYSASYLPFTARLEEIYFERYGESLADKIWMLYFDSEESYTVRYRYRVIMRDLLEDNYFKKVADWCHSHNLLFSGHLMMEDTVLTQIMRAQACMPYYKYFDIPGIDVLRGTMNWVDDPINQTEPQYKTNVLYITPLQCVSAAKQAGKKHILAEMYGVAGENFGFRNMTHMFDSYAASGINHRSVHGIFYTLFGRGKRAYPPHVNYYQPYWEKYKNITDYCARVSSFISEGRPCTDIAILHPLESGYVLYRAQINGRVTDNKEINSLDTALYNLLVSLKSSKKDVDFVDDSTLRDCGKAEAGRLLVGEMSYKTIILPRLCTISKSTLSILEKFAKDGGKIIIYGQVPNLLDGVYDASLEARLSAISTKTDSLSSLICMLPDLPLKIDGIGAEMLFVNLRVCDSGEKIFIFNKDCAHEAKVTIKPKAKATLYKYDAFTGAIFEYPYKEADGYISADLTIAAGASVLLSLEQKRQDALPFVQASKLQAYLSIDGEWQVTPHSENAFYLEYCQYKKAGGEYSNKLPIMAIQHILTSENYHGNISLKYEFYSKDELDNLRLAIEDPHNQEITIDGKKVDDNILGYFCDKSFKMLSLGNLGVGKHVLEISREFHPLTKVTNSLTQLFETRYGVELEPMYLVGEFLAEGVAVCTDNGSKAFENEFVLKQIPKEVTTAGELTANGFPFFVGQISLTKDIFIKDIDYSNAKLSLGVMNACCAEVYVNDCYAGDINRAPAQVNVSHLLKDGSNTIKIKLFTTLYNIVGPFHRPLGNIGNTFGNGYSASGAAWLTVDTTAENWDKRMGDFYQTWTDRYNVAPLGIKEVAIKL